MPGAAVAGASAGIGCDAGAGRGAGFLTACLGLAGAGLFATTRFLGAADRVVPLRFAALRVAALRFGPLRVAAFLRVVFLAVRLGAVRFALPAFFFERADFFAIESSGSGTRHARRKVAPLCHSFAARHAPPRPGPAARPASVGAGARHPQGADDGADGRSVRSSEVAIRRHSGARLHPCRPRRRARGCPAEACPLLSRPAGRILDIGRSDRRRFGATARKGESPAVRKLFICRRIWTHGEPFSLDSRVARS